MSFVKKIWKDRISQFPNRRIINDGSVTKQVTVGRDEGVVTEEGTPFDATEMNDLENRIFAAIEQGGGGGGSSGTYDYSELFNKPRVNNVELNGNKTTADLHIDYNALENKPNIPENATELPISSSDTTNTKEYIDTGLSGKVNNSMTATTDTANGKRLSGGYIQIGNIVFVDINVELLASTDYTKALQTGLPTPIDNKNVQIIGNNYDTWDYQPNAVLYGFRLANGVVYHNVNTPLASGTKLHIFGSYICES